MVSPYSAHASLGSCRRCGGRLALRRDATRAAGLVFGVAAKESAGERCLLISCALVLRDRRCGDISREYGDAARRCSRVSLCFGVFRDVEKRSH